MFVDDVPGVGRPRGEPVVGAVVDDRPEARAVRFDRRDLRRRRAGRAEVSADAEQDRIAIRRPAGIEGRRAGGVIERPLAAAIGVHDLDAGVGGVHPLVRILAVYQLCAVRRERGEGLAQKKLELRIDASGRDEVLGHRLSEGALVDEMSAIGRPLRAASGAFRDVHDAEVGMPHLDPFLRGDSAAHRKPNPASGQERRRQLGLVGGGEQGPLATADVHGHELRARTGALRHVRPDLVGFVEEDRRAIRRPRRAAGDSTGLADSAHAGSVGMHDVDAGGLQQLPVTGIDARRPFAIGAEGDPRAVGRPGRPEIAALARGQVRGLAGGEIQEPQVGCPDPRVETKASVRPSGERAP